MASWHNSVASAGLEIRNDIRDSPSLRRHIEDNLSQTYSDALEEALIQMNRQAADVHAACPWTFSQPLDGGIPSLQPQQQPRTPIGYNPSIKGALRMRIPQAILV